MLQRDLFDCTETRMKHPDTNEVIIVCLERSVWSCVSGNINNGKYIVSVKFCTSRHEVISDHWLYGLHNAAKWTMNAIQVRCAPSAAVDETHEDV